MGYYMGDYRGDYYGLSRQAFGDPGFLSFFKGVGKVIGRLSGLGGGGGATKVIQLPGPAVMGRVPQIARTTRAIVKRGVGIVKKHPVLTAAGAAGAIGAATGAGAEALMGAGRRKGRRMNPYNPRALRRALRRAHAFSKMALRIVRVTKRYKKPRGRMAYGSYGRKKRRA